MLIIKTGEEAKLKEHRDLCKEPCMYSCPNFWFLIIRLRASRITPLSILPWWLQRVWSPQWTHMWFTHPDYNARVFWICLGSLSYPERFLPSCLSISSSFWKNRISVSCNTAVEVTNSASVPLGMSLLPRHVFLASLQSRCEPLLAESWFLLRILRVSRVQASRYWRSPPHF